MKTNKAKLFTAVLAAAIYAGWTGQALAFWTDGGQGGGALEQLGISADERDNMEIPVPKEVSMAGDQAAGASFQPVEWVYIEGGRFSMGTEDGGQPFRDARPVHEVAIKDFEMSKTVVTVEQYAECVTKGDCTEPGIGDYCNWGEKLRQHYPVNCVSWDQADKYARFKGARLPTESEWEYAARSGGRDQKYPWGNDEPTCDKAVMQGRFHAGCDKELTWPVCSKPAGNTAQGLCDMAGNVWQWVQDKFQDSYKDAPTDGSAFEGAGSPRVLRGGSFYSDRATYLWASYRYGNVPGYRLGPGRDAPFINGYDLKPDKNDKFAPYSGVGFRIARSKRP